MAKSDELRRMSGTSANPDTFVAHLWSLCNVLRGDGIGYNQYVSELTYLLFLKIAKETGAENLLPIGYRWDDLIGYQGDNLLGHYQEMLTHLGASAESELVRNIYAFPTTVFSHSENLSAVVDGINNLEWHSLSTDAIGLVYEGLLAKNSEDSRSGAGQYFTSRALVDCMVSVLQPKLGETIQDPSVGTGGFLISADQYIRAGNTSEEYAKNPPKFEGMEIERGTFRLCLMNAFLHGIDAKIVLGDTLTSDVSKLRKADVILANPPFGTRASGARTYRDDFSFTSSNKQLQFLQHIYRSLNVGGRAAVILPDNVLFESGGARRVREELMDLCNLHTILRLPTGIFYAQNVSTHVLFFTRGSENTNNTSDTWVFDLRTDMPRFGKRRQLSANDFKEFTEFYGDLPTGESIRKEGGPKTRYRRFTRDQIAQNAEELSVGWLHENVKDQDIPENDPEELAQQILMRLEWAAADIRSVSEELRAVVSESEGVGED